MSSMIYKFPFPYYSTQGALSVFARNKWGPRDNSQSSVQDIDFPRIENSSKLHQILAEVIQTRALSIT